MPTHHNMADVAAEATACTVCADIENPPFQLHMSSDPIDNITTRTFHIFGVHPTLGMILELCSHKNISKNDKHPVSTIQDISTIVSKLRSMKMSTIVIEYATNDKVSMHPQDGTSPIYHD